LLDFSLDITIHNYQIYVIWTVNPDGVNYVWTEDNMWRKNRRQNDDGTWGVDLNRNYPVGWNFSCGGSTTPSSEEYRGPSPASEPETQNLVKFLSSFKFAKVIDFHSMGREVRQIYAECATLPPLLDLYFSAIGEKMADAAAYLKARSCCMGGHPAFSFNTHGGLSYLIETALEFQPPAEQMQQELVRIWPLALLFLELPIPIFGHVIDQVSGSPLEAKITIEGLVFNYNENFPSGLPFGRFHLWLPAGTWTLRFTAPGYQTVTVEVTSPSLDAIDVKLPKI